MFSLEARNKQEYTIISKSARSLLICSLHYSFERENRSVHGYVGIDNMMWCKERQKNIDSIICKDPFRTFYCTVLIKALALVSCDEAPILIQDTNRIQYRYIDIEKSRKIRYGHN